MVVWILELSGAGKTTLCEALRALIKSALPSLVILDGDAVRHAFSHDLNHHEEHRVIQFRRLQGMARVLVEQDIPVVVAAVYCNPELLSWNRQNLPGYFEVYLSASLDTVRARDPKGIYADAEAGRLRDVVGIDIPFQAPATSDLVLDANNPDPPHELALRVARSVPQLAGALAHVTTVA